MENEKDFRLVNIYIRIHNKEPLTMDDLAYLAKYNPDCFKKTCDILLNRMPEAKVLLEPRRTAEISEKERVRAEKIKAFHEKAPVNMAKLQNVVKTKEEASESEGALQEIDFDAEMSLIMGMKPGEEVFLPRDRQAAFSEAEKELFQLLVEEGIQGAQMIQQMFESLEEIESGELDTIQEINTVKVKELLGDLFMEHIFPHTGMPEFFDIMKEEAGKKFNRKA